MNIRGVATKFRLGGRIQVSQNHLPPNSDFSSDFAHFISEIPENPNFSVNIQKIFLKNRDFWRGASPRNSEPGGHVPHPPGGDAHDEHCSSWCWMCARTLCSQSVMIYGCHMTLEYYHYLAMASPSDYGV